MIHHDLTALLGAGSNPDHGLPARQRSKPATGLAILVDEHHAARCLSLRITSGIPRSFSLPGAYRLRLCTAGGWLLENVNTGGPDYWLPQLPRLRRLNRHAHVLEERDAPWSGLQLLPDALVIEFPALADGWVLDGVVWQLTDPALRNELTALRTVEGQGYFLLGSHTCYRQPADLYRHLLHGHIYEDRFAWPHQRKVCSENDAHALWQIFSGLALATGKHLYAVLKAQVLLSVLDRQGEDGGYHHGEWTDNFESHYRLHCSAMHLLMDALEESDSPLVRHGLRQAAGFLARTTDELDCGRWFLHDELELSQAALATGPARYLPSRAFGKSLSNLLVLNTHLDSTIAMDRYGALTGDPTHQPLVDAANRATNRVLASRPAESLFRVLFRLIELTFLPTEHASRLPAWRRALKRIAWKFLIPRLPALKNRFPRLAMPGGYIDRELSALGFAHDYHAVNLMDLARHQRRSPSSVRDQALADGLAVVRRSGLDKRWKEMSYHRYALGFWAEALYQAYLFNPSPQLLNWLAGAVLDLEDAGLGVPPSLLGANAECTPVARQRAITWPDTPGLRAVNLSRGSTTEVLLVNCGRLALPLPETSPGLSWLDPAGGPVHTDQATIAPRGCLHGSRTD